MLKRLIEQNPGGPYFRCGIANAGKLEEIYKRDPSFEEVEEAADLLELDIKHKLPVDDKGRDNLKRHDTLALDEVLKNTSKFEPPTK